MSAATLGRAGARALCGAWILALLLAGHARAADETAVLLLRAEQLASEERCAEALPVVRSVRERDPGSARAALLEGECLIREQRYAEAIAPLEDARRLDPALDRVSLNLGIAQLQAGDKQAALRELDRAVEAMPSNAQAHLYRGLVLLELADAEGAVAALEQARSLDPGAVDPAASYYAGRAFQLAEQREEAERSLEQAIAFDPDSEWARQAGLALEGSRASIRRRGLWAHLSAGMEYDTNVILLGGVTPGSVGVPPIDEDDARGVWFGRTGAELFRGEGWATGVVADYYGNAQIDLDRFDTHFPSVGAYVDRLIGESTYLRFQPDFGYSWIDYDDFLLIAGATPSLHHAYERAGHGRAYFRFEYRDYLFPVNKTPTLSPSAVDRDGNNYIGGYDHSYPLTDTTEIRGSVGANYYDSERGEYTYVAPAVGTGVNQELPWDVILDLGFIYRHEFYENRSSFPKKVIPPPPPPPVLPGTAVLVDRDEDLYLLTLVLEKRLTENLLVSGRYIYSNHDSNIPTFDYDRHIAGAFLTVEFGPE